MAGKFEILKSASGGFRFNLKSGNNETILSSENYQTEQGARNGAESVKRNAANDVAFERKTSTSGQQYFVLKAGNGETIGTSETYSSEKALEKAIASIKNNAPDAEIVSSSDA